MQLKKINRLMMSQSARNKALIKPLLTQISFNTKFFKTFLI